MSVEEAITAALLGDVDFAALVDDQIFPIGGARDAVPPYVTYQRIGTVGAAHLDGPSNLDWPRFQFTIWGRTALQARQVAEALRTYLDRIEREGNGLTFEATFQDDRSLGADEQTRNHGVAQDYLIFHER